LKVDPTNYAFVKNSVGFIIYSLAIFFIFNKIPYLKSLGTAMFAGAGIIAAIIGFASQKAFSNIISGIFILIFKPFRVHDTIEFLDSTKGIVEEITLRHTIIRNYENRRIVIPNSNISDATIINSNILDPQVRIHIAFGVGYDSDINKATEIIRDECVKHPLCIDNRTDEEKQNGLPAVLIRMVEIADSAIILKAYVWTNGNDEAFALKCDVLASVFERLNEEGIEQPYPYRTIVYKKDIEEEN
jgi:small-conductance mechanosensitive channel